MRRYWTLVPAALAAVWALGLGGCIIIDDDDPWGSPPMIHGGAGTYWFCEFDAASHDFYYEFQAEVTDPDGRHDVRFVEVSFYDAYTGAFVDRVELFEEGYDIWGAWSMERETDLWCGDPYEVVFYAEDWDGNSDSHIIAYAHDAPEIDPSPIETWVDCYEDGHDWIFEFQALVDDTDGFEDVAYVTVEFVDAVDGDLDGVFTLNYEGSGYWGGWIGEGENNELYCGDTYDVVFTATDRSGLSDTHTFTWTG